MRDRFVIYWQNENTFKGINVDQKYVFTDISDNYSQFIFNLTIYCVFSEEAYKSHFGQK